MFLFFKVLSSDEKRETIRLLEETIKETIVQSYCNLSYTPESVVNETNNVSQHMNSFFVLAEDCFSSCSVEKKKLIDVIKKIIFVSLTMINFYAKIGIMKKLISPE